MGKCEGCGFWVYKESSASPKHYGDCRCPKFCYEYPDKEGDTNNLLYMDCEGYSAEFETGKDFGCIHWKPKEA